MFPKSCGGLELFDSEPPTTRIDCAGRVLGDEGQLPTRPAFSRPPHKFIPHHPERFVMVCLFGFGVGPWELAALAIIVLLLFGSRLPNVMRSLGQGVVEFKKGVQGIEEDENEDGAPNRKKNLSKNDHSEDNEPVAANAANTKA